MKLFSFHSGWKKQGEPKPFSGNLLENTIGKRNEGVVSPKQIRREAKFFSTLPNGTQAVIDMKAALERYGGFARKQVLNEMKDRFQYQDDASEACLAEMHIVALIFSDPRIVEYISAQENKRLVKNSMTAIGLMCYDCAENQQGKNEAMREFMRIKKAAKITKKALGLINNAHFARVAGALTPYTHEESALLVTISNLAETNMKEAQRLLQFLAGLDEDSIKTALASADELGQGIYGKKPLSDEQMKAEKERLRELNDIENELEKILPKDDPLFGIYWFEHVLGSDREERDRRLSKLIDKMPVQTDEEMAHLIIEIGLFNEKIKKLSETPKEDGKKPESKA